MPIFLDLITQVIFQGDGSRIHDHAGPTDVWVMGLSST